jgi:adenosine deaminase
MSIESYIRAAPKAELHLHLEGAIRPATALELAQRNGVALPAGVADGLRTGFRFRDFMHFIETYVAVTRCLRTAEDYEQVVYELGADLARQNVRYAEVTFSPSTHEYGLGVSWDTFFAGLTRGRRRVERDFGIQLQWVFDIVRDPTYADYVLRVASEGMAEAVVALGVVGLDVTSPAAAFVPWFERARAAELHVTPHAGETTGPQSVWGALRLLGAERIGHGVRAIEDPALVAHLAEHCIALEVCPTSNVCLGVFPSLEAHPLRRLYDAGVPITVNSDDPPFFTTTLTDDLLTLPSAFGFTAGRLEELDDILLNAVRYSFLPSDRKAALETEFRAQLATLKQTHLDRR